MGHNEIESLFDVWNSALETGDPEQVVALYAPSAILLPTMSNRGRHTHEEIKDYFVHFLEKSPERLPEVCLRMESGYRRNPVVDAVHIL